MSAESIRRHRLASQRLIGDGFAKPGDDLAWLGAVQSQDFAGAAWAIGLRMHEAIEATIIAAFNRGEFLRTHALRPTWHFLAPADLRWIQALTGSRVQAKNQGRNRQLALDSKQLTRGATIITEALSDGQSLTRIELGQALSLHGIATDGQRLAYLVMYAELEGLICSGPLRGRQHTYALVDERVPATPPVEREEALRELSLRFFRSRGPATDRDLAWWSGLTLADCRNAIALAGKALERIEWGGVTLWSGPTRDVATPDTPLVHLLPNFDEYYSRAPHTGLADDVEEDRRRLDTAVGRRFVHHVVIDGAFRGGWRRETTATTVRVELDAHVAASGPERAAIADAAAGYGAYLQREVSVTWPPAGAP